MSDSSDEDVLTPEELREIDTSPAYLKFEGEMREAFDILTDSMNKKGSEQLVSYGKFKQTYAEGADQLKQTPDFSATEFNTQISSQLSKDLAATAAPTTPPNIAPFMKEMVEICANFLAQLAEFNKDKGPAFKFLVQEMKKKPKDELYQKEKINRTYAQGAVKLEQAKGLETDHDDPNLSQSIHAKLSDLVKSKAPAELQTEMPETLDLVSKYLSENAVDEVERGPAFDILIKKLETQASRDFTPQFAPVKSNFNAAYVLKSAPGLCSVTPDPATVPIFTEALHKRVDAVCPEKLKEEMEEVIGRCANYLSAFVRDRDKALEIVVKALKKTASKELATRNNYTMDYGTGALETETAPAIVPYCPVKDIADEMKGKITKDTEADTPSNLKIAMKSAVSDVAKHLSQGSAARSGAAGSRYQLNLLSAVMTSTSDKKLFTEKNYTQTYVEGGDVLKYAGQLESDPKAENLRVEIDAELHEGVPTKLAPTVTTSIGDTMNEASKHLAKAGREKAEAVEHLIKVMKEEGETPLGLLQGYEQTFNDGARRVVNADTLRNDKVDKGAYENVHNKLKAVMEKNPNEATAEVMPAVLDEVARFLAAPFPETDEDKRKVLRDLMGRKGDEILGQEGVYKMTYTEGGKDIVDAPVGVTKAYDDAKKQEMEGKINAVIPDKKLQDALHTTAEEGAAYLTDHVKGVGEAMGIIEGGLKKEGDREFLHVGQFNKTYGGAGEMLHNAPKFGGEHPNVTLKDAVDDLLEHLDKAGASEMASKNMNDAIDMASNYIADTATKECGLDAQGISKWKASGGGGAGAEDEAARQARLQAEQDAAGRSGGAEDEAARLARLKAERDAARRKRRSGGDTDADAAERREALDILHRQLQAKGGETFYKQPHSELSHNSASEWLKNPTMKVPQSVKESGDTTRLAKKFERKLNALVDKVTPPHLTDSMQDVVIESSRSLSEYFVAENYKALVKDALISEMQKHGNENLIDKNGLSETNFFAAQRLKKVGGKVPPAPLDVEPSRSISHLYKRLEETIRCRSMPRKLIGTMKEHIRYTAHYLSDIVTTPDPTIEAYVALLKEMDAHGDELLIQGEIPKSYKDSAAYLRLLTSCEDQINLPNSTLEGTTTNNLLNIMRDVPAIGYTKADLDVEKTALLKLVVERMDATPDRLLLRHGEIRKSNTDGAHILSGKNTDQLSVTTADPVVERKVQIKIVTLMEGAIPDNKKGLMEGVISDATRYLAVHLLRPHVIQVCKCMKSVFVQCELWCDEILRRMSRPCCSCSRQLKMGALADLAPGERLVCPPGTGRAYAPGIDITVKPCSRACRRSSVCPAAEPTEGCQSTAASYMLYSTEYNRQRQYVIGPTRLPRPQLYESTAQNLSSISYSSLDEANSSSQMSSFTGHQSMSPDIAGSYSVASSTRSRECHTSESNSLTLSYHTPASFIQSDLRSNRPSTLRATPAAIYTESGPQVEFPYSETQAESLELERPQEYESYGPVVTTDQMADWHAMMVSLTWNVQAWRKWIQDTIDSAMLYHHTSQCHGLIAAKPNESWVEFRRKIATEALQWRQYYNFSRQLISRLTLRYQNRRIVSPTRATVKNKDYMECQNEIMRIIDMFNRWTHWLSVIVKETDSLRPSSSSAALPHDLRWTYFKNKVEECAEDWKHYNSHLKRYWEHQYMALIPELLVAWNQGGPVWVVSACGAVPSGAVAAGAVDGETTWLARSTHRRRVLPAALRPSQHCCVLYADGAPHHYTKYQVLCNAAVEWVSWQAGTVPERAVHVAPRVHAGRVLYRGAHLVGAVPAPAYRCHVVVHGRAFAFNSYELLVLADQEA